MAFIRLPDVRSAAVKCERRIPIDLVFCYAIKISSHTPNVPSSRSDALWNSVAWKWAQGLNLTFRSVKSELTLFRCTSALKSSHTHLITVIRWWTLSISDQAKLQVCSSPALALAPFRCRIFRHKSKGRYSTSQITANPHVWAGILKSCLPTLESNVKYEPFGEQFSCLEYDYLISSLGDRDASPTHTVDRL